MAAIVTIDTAPEGYTPAPRWTDLTADWVAESKTPVTWTGRPRPASRLWRWRTRAPRSPRRRPRGARGGWVTVGEGFVGFEFGFGFVGFGFGFVGFGFVAFGFGFVAFGFGFVAAGAFADGGRY